MAARSEGVNPHCMRNRIAVAVVLAAFVICSVRSEWARANGIRVFETATDWAAIPLVPVLVYCLVNLLIFPFSYGVFGRWRRASPPTESPRLTLRWSWVCIGRGAPGRMSATWKVYPTGVSLTIHLYGQVFLPKECVTGVRVMRSGGCAVKHSCPEVRSPIAMPAQIFRALADCWAETAPSHMSTGASTGESPFR
jgi:hypothetical protein